jgi:hypothetical protein
LFQNDDENYPLSNGGTGFIVNFGQRLLVVTAKHVLREKVFDIGQFRVQYRPDAQRFLPLNLLYYPTPIEGYDDTDQFDVAVLGIDQQRLEADHFGDDQPYTLPPTDGLTIFNPAAAYIYRGYPISERQFDFENANERSARLTSVTTRARYVGATNSECVHELALLNLAPVRSIDGMSGSPVFQVVNDPDGIHSTETFAGMLIRGAIEAGRAYFIHHRRIIFLLERVLEQPNPLAQ